MKISVLDEADEMLSMGFQEDVETIFSALPAPGERQTVLFSATLPAWVNRIASTHLVRPAVYDAVGKGINRSATTVKHIAIKVPSSDEARAAALENIVSVYGGTGKVRCASCCSSLVALCMHHRKLHNPPCPRRSSSSRRPRAKPMPSLEAPASSGSTHRPSMVT